MRHTQSDVSYLGRLGGYFSSLGVLALSEEEIELADKQLLGSTEVVASCHAECQLWVGQRVGNVRYNTAIIY